MGRVNPCFQGVCEFSAFQFFNFSVLRQGVDPRVQRTHFFTALGVVWRQIRGRWNRKSDFSNTFELGRDAYRETVEHVPIKKFWLNQIFIILQSGTSTAVLSLYRSTIFRLQCSKCLQTWTFMVVQSNWSWLPTIVLLAFYVDVSERNNHFSRNPPIAFERTEESSSFNSWIFISVLSSTEFVARTISVICTERLRFVRYSQRVVADKYQRR